MLKQRKNLRIPLNLMETLSLQKLSIGESKRECEMKYDISAKIFSKRRTLT
jgi:hypothetical protein